MSRALVGLALALCSCAGAPERVEITAPALDARRAAPVLPGDTEEFVRRQLGPYVEDRPISPTEKILSGIHGDPCRPAKPDAPFDATKGPCGAAWMVRARVKDGRVVEVSLGEDGPFDPGTTPPTP